MASGNGRGRRRNKPRRCWLIVCLTSRGPTHAIVRGRRLTVASVQRAKRRAGAPFDAPVRAYPLSEEA